ncbi:MAG: FAD:protein FMN transferase [Clostridia bacterium]|nr:FAD:protein FMN transferase [Clostridia bacterium]
MKSRNAVLLVLTVLACVAIVLVNWVAPPIQKTIEYTKYSTVRLNVFDTEITLIGFAESEEAFAKNAEQAFELLENLDRIFDAYNAYDGLNNLYYLNRRAAQEPVPVPRELFELISWCKQKWDENLRSTNIAMGAVLSIWHDYRTAGIASPDEAALPPMETLQAAEAHTDFQNVVLDANKQTVFYSDPELQLDIGAVAKGYAADAASALLSKSMPSFLLSLGGNVYAGEKPLDGRSAWAVGVQDPRAKALEASISGSDILDIIDVTGLSVVTSGDYWRYYTVDGVRYHHIIDPKTLMPSTQMQSVTVVCQSSILADFLSTALFVNSYEDGLALVNSLPGVEAMWVLPDGKIEYSAGMTKFVRSLQ